MTKGVFSHHFPEGKDDLTVAVIEANSAQVRSGFVDVLTEGGPPAAVVMALFSGYTTMMRSKGNDFGCPIAASVVDVATLEGTILTARAEGDPELMRRTGRRLAALVVGAG